MNLQQTNQLKSLEFLKYVKTIIRNMQKIELIKYNIMNKDINMVNYTSKKS